MDKSALSVKDILSNKEKFLNRKNKKKTLYIKSIDSNIEIRALTLEEASYAFSIEHENADCWVVYNAIVSPNLKDTELHESFGCDNPYDIVEILFTPGEIVNISMQILELSGYGKGGVIEDVKN